MFTPPHHSDLQPIELVWAIVKGTVGRQYTKERKFAEVHSKLLDAFDGLTSQQIRGCINKAEKHLKVLADHIETLDRLDAPCENESESDRDTGSDSDASECATNWMSLLLQ